MNSSSNYSFSKKLISIFLLFFVFAFSANAEDKELTRLGAFFVSAHSGIVQHDGSLLAWGENRHGELGYKTFNEGGADNVLSPKLILKDVKMLSHGYNASAIVKKDGTLWTTGNNDEGILGDGTTQSRSNYKKIMNDVAFVSLGAFYGLAVKNDGSLWAWGDNDYGQFCNGTTESSLVPVQVADNVSTAYAGKYHTAFFKTDGTLWMCGYNYDGQLGIGRYSPNDRELNPVQVQFLDSNDNVIPIKQVSLSDVSTLFLLEDDTLWFSGDDFYGSACLGEDFYFSNTPAKVADNVKLVRNGNDKTAFITNDNTLWMCGYNGSGQLGIGEHGPTDKIYRPVKVLENVEDVAMGGAHSLALTQDGSLYCWGHNAQGQCGLGYYYHDGKYTVDSPAKVKLPINIPEGKTLAYTGKKQQGVEEGVGYQIVKGGTGTKVGNYKAELKLASGYSWTDGTTTNKIVKWKIVKAPNTLEVTGKQANVKFKKVSKGDVFIARKKLYTIKQNKGALTFKKASGNKKILVEKDAGTMKVSKGLKKGTYTVNVKITAKGNESYKPVTKVAVVIIVIG